jgi:hypothetical protein
MILAALAYAKQGFRVFPLRPRSKIPATQNGFKDATTNEEQIRQWWSANTEFNIGIATGNGLLVLDVDAKNGGLASLEEHIPYTDTLTVATGGGGYHFYFKADQEFRNRAGIFPGVDIRADGGYVVAPPSIHENGSPYRVTKECGAEALPVPAWLKEKLSRSSEPVIARAGTELPAGEKGELNKRTLKFIVDGALPGTWHQELFQAAMDLKQNGYDFEEARDKLESGTVTLDSSHDIPQLLDVYENREPKYAPNVDPVDTIVVSALSLVDEMFSHLSDKDLVKGLPRGIDGLDALLGGGARLGEVTAWHAEAKTGKNTLWHYLQHKWLQQGVSIGYASRELKPSTEVLPNILSIHANENALLAEMTEARIARYRAAVASWPLSFADGYGLMEIDEIHRWMDALQKKGVQYYFFDHLHYMLADPEDHKGASKLIKEIKTLAQERQVHIDIIIQPNKLMDGQRLSLNSLKGGSAMGQAVDNFITMERVANVKDVSKVSLNRVRSKLGTPGEIYLQYNRQTMTFQEVEPQADEVPPPRRFGDDYQLPRTSFNS